MLDRKKEDIKDIIKVIKSYLINFAIIAVCILVGLNLKFNLNYIKSHYALILATLFYSFGTLGFLVNVTTWNGESSAEKISKTILTICYCLGTILTMLSM